MYWLKIDGKPSYGSSIFCRRYGGYRDIPKWVIHLKMPKKLTEADLLKDITAYDAHADEFVVATLPQELEY